MRKDRRHPHRTPLRVERIIAAASITQDSYRARHKADTDSQNEIDIEVFPDQEGKNIARINGGYQSFQCMLDGDDLENLPFRLQGTGGSLSDRMKFHLKGQVDKNGKFNLFVTGLATTMVQFKLWGKVFPDVKCPAKAITPDIFRDEVFRRIGRFKSSTNPGLREWVTGMTNFWDKWSGIFQMDVQKEVVRKLEEMNDSLNERIVTLQDQINQSEMRIEELEAALQKICKRLLLNGIAPRR